MHHGKFPQFPPVTAWIGLAAVLAAACTRNADPRRGSVPPSSPPRLRTVRLSPLNDGRMLPREAYRAEIVLAGTAPPTEVRAGGGAEYSVIVKNLGPVPFPAFPDARGRGAVNLTCRIYRADAQHAEVGGCNRVSMAEDLRPGDQFAATIAVPYPVQPGEYEVRIELVHEVLTWFVDQGARPLAIRIRAA